MYKKRQRSTYAITSTKLVLDLKSNAAKLSLSSSSILVVRIEIKLMDTDYILNFTKLIYRNTREKIAQIVMLSIDHRLVITK